MDERDARVLRLSRARREDSDDRRHRVLAIVDGLAADSRPLPIAELARRANVHRSFLYRHPDLYELAVATPLRKELAELEAERDRLRAVVEATRTFIAAQVDADSTPDQDAATWNAMIDAFHQLDGSAGATRDG